MTAMCRLAISLLLLAFAAHAWAWGQSTNPGNNQSNGQSKDQPADELQSRIASARPEDRPALCIQLAQSQLRIADKLYTDGQAEQARAAVADVATYSQKAGNAAIQSRKHMKNVEIAVRKMAEKLRDIKRTLNFEDQPPVEQAIVSLEDVRTVLLKEMFKKEKK